VGSQDVGEKWSTGIVAYHEIVELARLSVTGAAEQLHVTRQAKSNLLNGHAGLSAEIAIRFEKAFGLKTETLMRMQASHELA
jgi:antitoxin HigA-1